jgi:hypothetical protein
MPPRLRKAAVAALAKDLDARSARPARARGAPSSTRDPERPAIRRAGPATAARYHCRTCDATFGPWAHAQRHADTVHHGARLELILRGTA